MKKALIIFTLITGATTLFAQKQPDSLLIQEIPEIQQTLLKQQQEIEGLNSRLNSQQAIINQQQNAINDLNTKSESLETTNDSLINLIETNRSHITSIADDLGTKIQKTEQNAETQFSQLGESLNKNQLFWIIAIIVTLLIVILISWLLYKRISTNKNSVESQIKDSQKIIEKQIKSTQKSLEEESLKLDSELVKVFQKQLEVLESTSKGIKTEEDHSLVLKIADRLTAMETNHYRMDPNTKGLKQLKSAVKSIKENYLAKGYEIVEMLETEYKEGMNVTANFIPSDKIDTGKKIITRVIKPQVNFNGKMIQAAQIEVSVGE
jgi:hypothetical protein